MHLARLANPSLGPKSYSLEKLTQFYEPQIIGTKNELLLALGEEVPIREKLFYEADSLLR
jgi:hypothetical protein